MNIAETIMIILVLGAEPFLLYWRYLWDFDDVDGDGVLSNRSVHAMDVQSKPSECKSLWVKALSFKMQGKIHKCLQPRSLFSYFAFCLQLTALLIHSQIHGCWLL